MLEEADEDEEFHDAMEEEPPEGIVVEDVEESKEEDEDEDKDETVQHSNFSDRPPFYQSLEPLRCKTQHPKQCSFEPASSLTKLSFLILVGSLILWPGEDMEIGFLG